MAYLLVTEVIQLLQDLSWLAWVASAGDEARVVLQQDGCRRRGAQDARHAIDDLPAARRKGRSRRLDESTYAHTTSYNCVTFPRSHYREIIIIMISHVMHIMSTRFGQVPAVADWHILCKGGIGCAPFPAVGIDADHANPPSLCRAQQLVQRHALISAQTIAVIVHVMCVR